VADRAVHWILLALHTSRSSIDSGRPADGLTLRHLAGLQDSFSVVAASLRTASRAKTHQRRSRSHGRGIRGVRGATVPLRGLPVIPRHQLALLDLAIAPGGGLTV
jgi:hypothetical protein